MCDNKQHTDCEVKQAFHCAINQLHCDIIEAETKLCDYIYSHIKPKKKNPK